MLHVEPEVPADRLLHLLGEMADEPGGAGQEGEAPHDGRREAEIGEGRAGPPAPLIGRVLPVAAAWTSATVRRSVRWWSGIPASSAMP